jgi:hypothetical protein
VGWGRVGLGGVGWDGVVTNRVVEVDRCFWAIHNPIFKLFRFTFVHFLQESLLNPC